jgi:hypothetical protein
MYGLNCSLYSFIESPLRLRSFAPLRETLVLRRCTAAFAAGKSKDIG